MTSFVLNTRTVCDFGCMTVTYHACHSPNTTIVWILSLLLTGTDDDDDDEEESVCPEEDTGDDPRVNPRAKKRVITLIDSVYRISLPRSCWGLMTLSNSSFQSQAQQE